jgi:hypothetical protein
MSRSTSHDSRTTCRWLGTAALALAAAVAIVRWVTMRTVYLESGAPSYGFPLPAYGWTAASSGEWWFAVVPAGLDLCVALVFTTPAALALARRVPPWVMALLGVASSVAMVVIQLPALLLVAIGAHHVLAGC